MGPIELAFLALWVVFGIVGWVRGFFKELGITLLIFAALIVVFFADRSLTPRLESMFGSRAGEIAILLYGGILLFGVLIAYQGQTISYQGKDPAGLEGDIWGILIGLFNGWLVIGTLWYYLNRYGYPIADIKPPLSGLAMTLIAFLPFNFIPADQLRNVLIGGLLFLLLLRVIR